MKKLAYALALALPILCAAHFAAAGAVDAKLLVGTWTKADNPKITWKFGADGSYATHTPALDNKGKYTVAESTLNTKLDELPAKVYTIVEVSASKLVLKDNAYSMTLEFKK